MIVQAKKQIYTCKCTSILYVCDLGLDARKTVFRGVVNTEGADHPAYLCSLISAFVICLLKSTTTKLATSKILIF